MLVDEMPAGREMDALVATKVLDWYHDPDPAADFRSWWFKNPELKGCPLFLAKFSTYIAAAWKVVEKLMERSLDFYVYTSQGDWICELLIYYVDDEEALIISEGHTPMLVICRTALKAAGVTEV